MRADLVIWREDFLESIQNEIQIDKLPHALLFVGQEGSGLMAHALKLAQSLLCRNQKQGKACNECSSCEKVKNLVHPDLHFTYPIVSIDKKNTADQFLHEWREYLVDRAYLDYFEWLSHISKDAVKQGNITKDECIRLIRSAQMKSYEGGRKVFVIWKAELLAKEGNRLLKIIEEPPEDTHFILLCNNVEHILPTILSRCQIQKFAPYRIEQLEALIKKIEPELAEQKRKEILYLSDHNAHRIVGLIENDSLLYSENFLQLLRQAYLRTDSSAQSKWIQSMSSIPREQMKLFFKYAIHFVNECVKGMVYPPQSYRKKLTLEEQKAANWAIDKFSMSQFEQMQGIFNRSIRYVDRNANARILFTNTMTKLIRLFHIKDVELSTI